jgi:hypothetical protein
MEPDFNHRGFRGEAMALWGEAVPDNPLEMPREPWHRHPG